MKRYLLLILICILCLSLAGCERRRKKGAATTTEETTEEVGLKEDGKTFTGVIEHIDVTNNMLTFINVMTDERIGLLYYGGVRITNKYGDIMALSSLGVGEVVDICYDDQELKLISLAVNPQAMRYEDITGFEIDTLEKKLKTTSAEYSYTDMVVVSGDKGLISIDELVNLDVIDMVEYDGKLCSVILKKGHGYLKLEDFDSYLGGIVEVGDVIAPVEEEMLLTVPEGDYELKIIKNDHSGTRLVSIKRNEETKVSLEALQIEPDKKGQCLFEITPKGISPQVYVDGSLLDLSKDVELIYGKHRILIVCDGYEDYMAYFNVDQPYKIFKFILTADGTGGTTAASTEEDSTEEDSTTTVPASTTEENSSSETASDTESEVVTTETEATTTEDSPGGNVKRTITISAPAGAKLYVDGKYVGNTPCSFTKTAGSHIITLTRTGCMTVSYTVTAVDNGQDDTYSFDDLEVIGSEVLSE